MPQTRTELYVHLVWSTWDRLPLVTEELERPVLGCIASKARELGCVVRAVGATVNHVHLLVDLPPTLTVSELAMGVKGVSSRLAGLRAEGSPFRWQGGYSAWTVSPQGVPHVARYIAHQKEHHAADTVDEELERA